MHSEFITASGKTIDLLNISPQDICIEDIAAGLSKECRFCGQIPVFYSVAQHCVIISKITPQSLQKAALLHDASEAYLKDITSPLKFVLGEAYKKVERDFMAAIFTRFELDIDLLPAIKEYDRLLYKLESEALRHGGFFQWKKFLLESGMNGDFWDWKMAHSMFHARYVQLFKKQIS